MDIRSVWGEGAAVRVAVLAFLGFVSIPGPATAVDLPGRTSAALQWSAASGPVAGYLVYVSRNGSDPSYAEQAVTAPQATVSGGAGDTLVVWVRAFVGSQLGPESPRSESIRFVPPGAPSSDDPSTVGLQITPSHVLAVGDYGHSPEAKSISLRAAGGSTVAYAISSNVSWASLEPGYGTSSGETDSVTLRFDTRGLPPGEHLGLLEAFTSTGDRVPIPITLRIRPPTADLDGDGASEALLWNRATGQVTALSRVLGSPTSIGSLPAGLPAQWQLLVSGDYDGDGKADLLWRSLATGAVVMCLMDGVETRACGSPFDRPSSLTLLGATDLNGDGRDDVTFRDLSTGAVEACFSNGLERAWCTSTIWFPPSWRVVTSGDHDGDGRAEVVAQAPGALQVSVCSVSGPSLGSCTQAPAVPGTQVEAGTDYDGDGKADLLWRSPTTGRLALSFPSLPGFASFRTLGYAAMDATLVGSLDLDGNGRAEVALRDAATGAVTLWTLGASGIVDTIALGPFGPEYLLGGSNPIQ